MQLEHSFTVPVGIEEAWTVLLDIEQVAPCMPGAALDSVDGDDFTGTVKVKLGPIGLTYKGKAGFVEKDATAHRAVIDARGRDARGNGTAAAKVTATLTEDGGATRVDVITDLDITGKPAQFGRGVMADVGNKLIGQFADCLAAKLTGAEPAVTPVPERPAEPAVTPKPRARATAAKAQPAEAVAEPIADAVPEPNAEPAVPPPPAPELVPDGPAVTPAARHAAPSRTAKDDIAPINLIQSAGPAVAKRLAPVAAVLVVLVILLRWRRKR